MFREIPQVRPALHLIAVKMANKGKMMTLGLALIVALTVSAILVNAETINLSNIQTENKPSTQCKPVNALSIETTRKVQTSLKAMNMAEYKPLPNAVCTQARKFEPSYDSIQLDEELEAEEFDEAVIDNYVEEYEQLKPEEIPDDEKLPRRCVWIVMSRGYSWETEPTTESVEPRNPLVLRFAAKPVMNTGEGILFKVLRGIVCHDDERYKVKGFGWLRKSDGIFFMKLEGGDIWLKVVGKVYPRPDMNADCVRRFRFHPVKMKGKMEVEGDEYCFVLKGRAFKLCFCSCDTLAKPEEAVVKSTTS